jgi:hypothetical protein
MGWLFMSTFGMRGFATPKTYLDNQLTYDPDPAQGRDTGLRVLRSTCQSRVYYAAIEPYTPEGTAMPAFAAVFLVRWNPNAQLGEHFGYKSMDETMGPCEASCPAAILGLLGPTTNEHAHEWRVRCRANLAHAASINAKPTPRIGQTIVFDPPLQMTSGRTAARFEVVANPRGTATPRYRDTETRQLCRIPGVKKRSYSLINPVVSG